MDPVAANPGRTAEEPSVADRLVRAAAEGDDAAVAELVRRTQPAVWQLCRAQGSGDDTDDLVQETYLRALRSLPSYRGDSSFHVWLLSIGRHVCADQVRRRTRQRRLIERLAPHRNPAAAPGADTSDSELADLLDHLPPERREAFVLTQLVGLGYEEAAGVVGCPIGTIRSRVSRARADLIDLLQHAEAM